MKEVWASFVFLAVTLKKVTSNHCITGDHITTYDNLICLPGVEWPCSGVPLVCNFPPLPISVLDGHSQFENYGRPFRNCGRCSSSGVETVAALAAAAAVALTIETLESAGRSQNVKSGPGFSFGMQFGRMELIPFRLWLWLPRTKDHLLHAVPITVRMSKNYLLHHLPISLRMPAA
ncbi:hypothetical protein GE061_019658 [Apolygus lucorum]|uniref:Uncharacterized protein n=1 Tax=Apolygus lucorum TaxID=248454 RepID=A0A6A4JFS2_APOLU|nr:hypothetical protein GE061_019658 [Apolygus lucorum]